MLETDVVDEARHVGDSSSKVYVAASPCRALAVTAMIEGDDSPLAGERLDHVGPVERAAGEAVNEGAAGSRRPGRRARGRPRSAASARTYQGRVTREGGVRIPTLVTEREAHVPGVKRTIPSLMRAAVDAAGDGPGSSPTTSSTRTRRLRPESSGARAAFGPSASASATACSSRRATPPTTCCRGLRSWSRRDPGSAQPEEHGRGARRLVSQVDPALIVTDADLARCSRPRDADGRCRVAVRERRRTVAVRPISTRAMSR